LAEDFGNPSSDHPYGLNARARVITARAEIATLLGCAPEEILITGGGSESNNQALRGIVEALGDRFGGLVISAVEHPAIVKPAAWLAARGVQLRVVPVDKFGRVDPGDVETAVRDLSCGGRLALVSIMHANNEVGTLQPIQEISRRVKSWGAILHTDAAQSVGKIPVDVTTLDVDLLTVAGHKLYGPKGIGALYIRAGTPMVPLILGAGQERGLRAGTENAPGMAGLGCACRLAHQRMPEDEPYARRLRDTFLRMLKERIPGIERNGHPVEVLPNTLNVSFPGVLGRHLLEKCPGLAASTGSACHAGEEKPSEILLKMGLSESRALGALRLSLGRHTEAAHVEKATDFLTDAWKALR
ncbi:MAG: cysteine desulfurase, partial [Candidatus Eisenbacteria bacterium]|nr:cysteine desulfurase [Candidatus Eisenbacteria bacterium]